MKTTHIQIGTDPKLTEHRVRERAIKSGWSPPSAELEYMDNGVWLLEVYDDVFRQLEADGFLEANGLQAEMP